MNLKPILSTLLLFCLSFYSISQKTIDEIKDEKIDFSTGKENNYAVIKRNMECFLGKEVDSLDLKILTNGPFLGSIIISCLNDSSDCTNLTYGLIYSTFLEFKKTPKYISNKRTFEISLYLEARLATVKNWKEDEKLFIELGIPDEKIIEYRTQIANNKDTAVTYKDFFEATTRKNTPDNKKEINDLLNNGQIIDIDSFLKKSKEVNKPIILYFTGYNCINCLKINKAILTSPEIADRLLNEFLFIPLYTDDSTELPIHKKGESSEIITVGNENLAYQKTHFNVVSQPYFVLLDSENTILGITDYEKNHQDIHEFSREHSLENTVGTFNEMALSYFIGGMVFNGGALLFGKTGEAFLTAERMGTLSVGWQMGSSLARGGLVRASQAVMNPELQNMSAGDMAQMALWLGLVPVAGGRVKQAVDTVFLGKSFFADATVKAMLGPSGVTQVERAFLIRKLTELKLASLPMSQRALYWGKLLGAGGTMAWGLHNGNAALSAFRHDEDMTEAIMRANQPENLLQTGLIFGAAQLGTYVANTATFPTTYGEFAEKNAEKSPEEIQEMYKVRQELHKESYYDPLVAKSEVHDQSTIEDAQKKQETEQQRMERMQQEDLNKKQEEDKKKQPISVTRAQTNIENKMGSSG